MLTIREHASVEEASRAMLPFILRPENWILAGKVNNESVASPSEGVAYQRRVGTLRICASVSVTDKLDSFIRVAFRGPGLTPMNAASHLEAFLKDRVPFLPNAEWQVEVDTRWISFVRRYTAAPLKG